MSRGGWREKAFLTSDAISAVSSLLFPLERNVWKCVWTCKGAKGNLFSFFADQLVPLTPARSSVDAPCQQQTQMFLQFSSPSFHQHPACPVKSSGEKPARSDPSRESAACSPAVRLKHHQPMWAVPAVQGLLFTCRTPTNHAPYGRGLPQPGPSPLSVPAPPQICFLNNLWTI